MRCPLCVFLFGKDPYLLDSRRLVLEKAGFRVISATGLSDLNQILIEHSVDILLLCHSLGADDFERAKSIVRIASPTVRVVALTVAEFVSSAAYVDKVVNTWDGPKALVEAVRQIGQTAGRASPSEGAEPVNARTERVSA